MGVAPSPSNFSPPTAHGELPGRLRAAPGRWQMPWAGKEPSGLQELLCRTALGSPGCSPSFSPCSRPWQQEPSCPVPLRVPRAAPLCSTSSPNHKRQQSHPYSHVSAGMGQL